MLNGIGKKSSAGENQKAVIASPIIAKSVMQKANGEFQIAVVFQKSTRLEFYWVFRARSARSSRRSWKLVGYFPRDFAYAMKPYRDFGSFVSHHSSINHLTVLSNKTMHKKRASSMLTRVDHESIFANWTPQDPSTIKTDMIRRRAMNARRHYAW